LSLKAFQFILRKRLRKTFCAFIAKKVQTNTKKATFARQMLWLIKNRGLDEPRRNNKLTELFGLVTNRERHILKGRR